MNDSILIVKLIEALDLKAMDYQGSSDPYCILEVEGQSEKSKVCTNTLNPTYNENFEFRIERGNEVLKISVWDLDKGDLKGDDF